MKIMLLVLVCVVLALAGCSAFKLTPEEIERSDELGGKALETQAELMDLYEQVREAKDKGLVESIPGLLAKIAVLQDDLTLYNDSIADIIREAKERSKDGSPWDTAANLIMQFLIGLVAYATGHKGRKIVTKSEV